MFLKSGRLESTLGRPKGTFKHHSNTESVKKLFEESTSLSLRKAASQLPISKSTIHHILRKSVFMKPYKPKKAQHLHPFDLQLRKAFAAEMLNEITHNDNEGAQ